MAEAAELMSVSYRQAKRILARFRLGGARRCNMAAAGASPCCGTSKKDSMNKCAGDLLQEARDAL